MHRRNAALHGGYLLATPLPLIMAVVVTRLPLGLVTKGRPLPAAFHPGFDLAMIITLVCVVALWRWQPNRPAPFITIGAATMLEWAGYHLAPAVPGWAEVGVAVAAASTWLVGGIGFAMGVAAMGSAGHAGNRSHARQRCVEWREFRAHPTETKPGVVFRPDRHVDVHADCGSAAYQLVTHAVSPGAGRIVRP